MADPDPVTTGSTTTSEDDGRTWYARLVGGGLLLIPMLLVYLLVALWPRPQGSLLCDWQKKPQTQKAQGETAARDGAGPEASPTPEAAAAAGETPPSEAAQPTESPADTESTPPEGSADGTTQTADGENKNKENWAEQWAPCAAVRPFTDEFRLVADVRILILVLLAGALGAYVHAAQSYASYIGNQKFKKQWTWWYMLRIPVGSALALFLYFTTRGGLLTGTTPPSETDDLNIFGIMSFAALAGLFSKQLIDKLAEVFSNFFKSEEDAKRSDKYDEDKGKGGNPPPGGGGGAGGTTTGASGTTGTTTGTSGGASSGTGASGSAIP
jgi:uncharacterized membrane protein YgcG